MEWRERLNRTSSLPPPWARNAATPGVAAQPASARPPSVSESQRSGQASMQRSCRPAEKCPSLAQTCLAGPRLVAEADAVSYRAGSIHRAYALVHGETASRGSEVSASKATAHEPPDGGLRSSQEQGKPLHWLQVIGQHISAQGQFQADLQALKLSVAAQQQLHDSASCDGQARTAGSSARPINREGRARSGGVAAAVLAAEGGVVALMAPNGSWASGVVVSAEHGYIVTVAHLLSDRRIPSGKQGQPVSSMAPHAGRSYGGSSASTQQLLKSSHASGAPPKLRSGQDSTDALQQQVCSSAYRQPQRDSGVLVQLWASGSADSQSMRPALPGSAGLSELRPDDGRMPFWAAASIVQCFEGHLDVAVLQLNSVELRGCLRELSLRPEGDAAVRQGDQIAVLGFPLLSPRLGFGPCVAASAIAKVGLSDSYRQAHCHV